MPAKTSPVASCSSARLSWLRSVLAPLATLSEYHFAASRRELASQTGTNIKQEHFARLFMSKVGLRPLLCPGCFANDPNRLLNGFLKLVFHDIKIIDTFFTRQNQLAEANPGKRIRFHGYDTTASIFRPYIRFSGKAPP